MSRIRPTVALGLAVLLVLAVAGKSAVMAASVLGMAVAWGSTPGRSLAARLGAAAVAGVAVALGAEAVHTLYHRVGGPGTGDDTGGFWRGALLVGAIDAAAFAAWVLAGEGARRWRQARARRSSAS